MLANQNNSNCCLASCGCLVIFLFMGFAICQFINVVWGSILLDENSGAKGECLEVWGYCLSMVIISACSILIAYLYYDEEDDEEAQRSKKKFTNLMSLFSLVLLIWGSVIYSKRENMYTFDESTMTCENFYKNNYENLWTMFQVYLWYNVATTCLSFTLVCCYLYLI